MKIRNTFQLISSLLLGCLLLISCEKEAMVVDRVVSPVAITLAGSSFAANEPVKVSATIVELDKSGILDHAVGIKSIPVANLPIQLKINNQIVAEGATNAAGLVAFEKTWAQLGLPAPQKNNVVTLEWTGSHKGQSFLKAGKVTVK